MKLNEALTIMVSVIQSSLMSHLALIMTETLNRQLKALLSAFFVNDPKSVDTLFGEFGPLGSFRSRIQMAAALGLISDLERHDLTMIRHIRNYPAHQPIPPASSQQVPPTLFENEKIKSRCSQLKLCQQYDPAIIDQLPIGNVTHNGSSETRFLQACALLICILGFRIDNLAHRETPQLLPEESVKSAIADANRIAARACS